MLEIRVMDATDATARKGSIVTLRTATVRGAQKFVVFSRIAGREKREFFGTRLEAQLHREAILDKLESKGTDAFDNVSSGLTVSQSWREFSQVRLPKLRKGNHTRLLIWWWGKFVAEYGTRDLNSIKPQHIDAFLARPSWSGTTAKQGFVYLRLVWNWLVRYEFVEKNPVLKIDVPKCTAEHHLLTVSEARRLLQLTQKNIRLRAWLVLGLFGGMRISEVWRCLPKHVEETEILVPKRKDTDLVDRRRFVPILPALRRNLPKSWDNLGEDLIKKERSELARAMGWSEWPQNCLRHTAASMHRAMWQDSAKTAYFLGHSSPRMVEEKYARAVREKEAKAFWDL